jgi:hypothetical protein
MSQTCQQRKNQFVLRAVPTYASCRKQNLPPSSIAGSEKPAVLYDDPTEYQPMIDAAFQSVADEVGKIINPPPANVVPLKKRMRPR